MPTAPLPENPSLEHLKAQAKLIRDLIRADDAGALAMIDEFHPRLDHALLEEAERAGFKTTDAQLIIARVYGFASWPQLRAHLGIVDKKSFTPLPEDAELSPADAFIVAACLDYAEHGPRPEVRIARAHEMLANDPSLAEASIAALATVGNHADLRRSLDAAPDSVNAAHGPNGWPLLLYATYSRITVVDEPDWSAVETVRLLLDRGADPNAGFLWRGLVPPFTALTGALGGGGSHQPWHPDRLDISRLLLDAGADPNDSQALYNNGIGGQNHDNPAHLQLLVEYGLGTQRHGPWYQQLSDRLRDPAELLYDELEAAAKRNRPTILRYLLSLGLDPDRPVGRSQLPTARIAAAEDHHAILEVLAEAGIDVDLTPTELALRCTRTNDVDTLNNLLDNHAQLLDDLHRDHPSLCRNVTAGDQAMLTRLLQLGFDINDRSTTKTPLHHAAEAGDTNRARILISHGADPNLSDTHIGATPWGWANHNGHTEAADYLHPLTHHDGAHHEITITSPTSTTTLATPELIDAHLDAIHQHPSPTLVTLRHDRTAITIGLGHPDVSVALYLGSDNVASHAAPNKRPTFTDEIAWSSNTGDKHFSPHTYLAAGQARTVASTFIADPGARPASVGWETEGTAT
ncbi:MAG: Imm1 family immunity protein [Actinomycetota bacterium]